VSVASLILAEHLSPADWAFLAAVSGETPDRLRTDPGRLEALVAAPETFEALRVRGGEAPFLVVSPFLVFAVLLARAARELGEVRYVGEWVAPGERVPVFDVDALRDLVAEPLRRLFLVELLASFTHVTSGTVLVRTGRGIRRRRFSELSVVDLAELALALPEERRLPVWRRLGDVALFLAGVFPDHAGARALSPVGIGRVRRALAAAEEPPGGTIQLLEWVGQRAYGMVRRASLAPETGPARALAEIADRFGHARRVLNFLTERFLYPRRESWFPRAA
jgi:hypothetical protein